MGIFDWFKKKDLNEAVLEKINFKDIENWIDNKKQKIKDNQKEPQKQIKVNLSGLLNELEKRVEILKNIDLDEKRAPERERLIVRENFNKFIYYLEKLILDLKELDSESFKELINTINSIFSEFEKKSLMSFQKSTFLIGKELGDVGDDIRKFFKLFNKIIKENKGLIEQGKVISVVEGKLNEIANLEKLESENNQTIKDIDKKKNYSENKIQELTKENEGVKESPEYIEYVRTKQKLEVLKTKLVIELQTLKETIDFKALAEVYHSIKDKIEMIKEYRDNFKESFEKYGPERFIDLIDIKAIDKNLVKGKIKIIENIGQEIDNIEVGEDVSLKLIQEIKIINRKIGELNIEKIGKVRFLGRLRDNVRVVKGEVVGELSKMVEVV